MTGYQSFAKKFKAGGFVSSKEIARRSNLEKALSSLYILPTFFKGVYYTPIERERKGHFINKPIEFFSKLFDYVYGRKKCYWTLSTAARSYGMEWSNTKILEIVNTNSSKTIDIFARAESLKNKKSYRSTILSKFLFSLEINLIISHKGKRNFLKETKIDSEIGLVATKERLKKDATFFLPRTKTNTLRQLYRKYLKKKN